MADHEGRVRLLLVFSSMRALTPDGAVEALRVIKGVVSLRGRLGVVSHGRMLGLMDAVMGTALGLDARVFAPADLEEARAWVKGRG